MNAPHAFFSVMAVTPLDVAPSEAETVARERWGITARASALRGERDRNFHLRADDGREFVLKFANPAEDAGFRDMQIAALRHIARAAPGLQVPQLVPVADGAAETLVPHASGAVQHVRLLTWVPGDLLVHTRRSAAQRIACGHALARLQLALRGFDHASRDHEVVWDLQHAARLRDIGFAIPHAAGRARQAELLGEFEARVLPLLPHLRRQMLHNDLNEHNMLAAPGDHDRITGVIDFGDLAETALVFDVAIAAVSQTGPDTDVATAIGQFVAGYHEVRPLPPEEATLLPLLMALRIAMGLTLSSWHRHTQPENPHFDLSDAAIQRRLARMDSYHTKAMDQAVRRACGLT
jgi:Ser/Thr protein kinase RdoA (MazF antagonist)